MNTSTIIGADFDPNAANNHASLTLSIPNPAAEEELPEVPANLPNNGEATLPNIPDIEERMDLDPNTPISSGTGSGSTGGSQGGSGSGSGNGGSGGGSGSGGGYNPAPTTQLEDDIDYIRKRFRDSTGLEKVKDTIDDIQLPEWKLSIDPPDIDQWEILDMALSAAGELIFLGTIAATPGAGEYLQQVQTGMSTGINSIKTGLRYFTKDRRIAFDLIKKGFRTMGKSFVDDTFMKSVSDRTFMLDPNVAQEVLVRGLCKFFPKQAAEIRTFFTILGSINFIKDPFGILKAWGEVVYSLFTEGISQGNYEETAKEFWEAMGKTFAEPIPNPLP